MIAASCYLVDCQEERHGFYFYFYLKQVIGIVAYWQESPQKKCLIIFYVMIRAAVLLFSFYHAGSIEDVGYVYETAFRINTL